MRTITRMVGPLGRRSGVGWALRRQPPAAGGAATNPAGWSMAPRPAGLLSLVAQVGLALLGQGGAKD